jgi:hypothetical protein
METTPKILSVFALPENTSLSKKIIIKFHLSVNFHLLEFEWAIRKCLTIHNSMNKNFSSKFESLC